MWRLVLTILFIWDAEKVHRLALKCISIFSWYPFRKVRIEAASWKKREHHNPFLDSFSNPLGLAAGFDKDAEVLAALPAFGFGFAEIGTVTPFPQEGNPKPRLFRDLSQCALFNQMGFNNLGAEEVSRRLKQARKILPANFKVGVNLGKNKDTPSELAARDYQKVAQAFRDLADYLVINVSSPNTPGLRDLQEVESLRKIYDLVAEEVSSWSFSPPILIKLAPELQDEDLAIRIEAGEKWNVGGWILVNTLRGTHGKQLGGGWSGGPLKEASLRSLKAVRGLTQKPIISVGGILNGSDARERLKMGADLIQVYTGWIYGGPFWPKKVGNEISLSLPSAE